LKFTQTADGLTVDLPGEKLSDLTCSLKITGGNLKPAAAPATAVKNIRADANGVLNFSATDAELHGTRLQLETQGGLPDIGFWNDGEEWISWQAQIPAPGIYKVNATIATPEGNAPFTIEVGGQKINAQAAATGAWDKFQTTPLGEVRIPQSGELTITVRAQNPAAWKAINVNSVQFSPVAAAGVIRN
jgi:alpha-L-fucosidase